MPRGQHAQKIDASCTNVCLVDPFWGRTEYVLDLRWGKLHGRGDTGEKYRMLGGLMLWDRASQIDRSACNNGSHAVDIFQGLRMSCELGHWGEQCRKMYPGGDTSCIDRFYSTVTWTGILLQVLVWGSDSSRCIPTSVTYHLPAGPK